MATETTPDFDLGPLSWVQAEIDQALGRGLEALSAYRKPPHDAGALKHARTHVHQAAGAIQMVGLEAVVAYTDEIERQLAGLDDLADPATGVAVCEAVDRACRKLQIFLAEVVNGAQPAPLRLFPEYEAMQRARGIRVVAPTDLFYPDLSTRAPAREDAHEVPPARLHSHLVRQRRTYQRGLLEWLRGEDDGAVAMREAVGAIADATTSPPLRAFWWTTGAVFDAVIHHGLDAGFGVKQLAARIDLQVRRVVEGSGKVADRLRREVLYYVAISAPVVPSVQEVQRAFRLAALIPSAEVMNADLVRLQPLLREARDHLSGAKDAWLKFTSGRAENLPRLKQTLVAVHRIAAEIGNGALMKLASSLVERLDKFSAGGVPEPLAMEYATGMLLAENAFENYTSMSAEFPKQVELMLERLDAAQASRPMLDGAAAPLLDEMSRRAQERLLLAQVCREIQANLRHIEQVLDAFFRDNTKRAELVSLAKDSQQIRGALQMLELAAADQLLALCQAQIEAYADPEAAVSYEDLELLAESLSGLGFYIEAVEQQRPDRDRLIAPLLARRLGEVAGVSEAAPADSAEAAVAELRATLPRLVDEVHRAPADAAARAALKSKLSDLRNDAELIGDAELAAQATSALAEFETGGAAALAATVTAMVETSAPAPEISAETQRLLATDATALDAELVEIYLAEADEVLDSIRDHLAVLTGNQGDREALRTIRRGFHTLKGSGRMVGLMDLGEVAYEVEKIHNRLLEEERPVTRAVLRMIETAESDFRQWVGALSSTGRVVADPRALHAAIRTVEFELPGGRESVLKRPAPATPAVVPAGPVPPVPPQEAPTPERLVTTKEVDEAPEPAPAPLPEIAFALDAVAPDKSAPAAEPLETFELPELGSAGAAAAVTPVMDFGSDESDAAIEFVPGVEPAVQPGLEVEQRETERLEAERLEAERVEAERLKAERLEAERLEAERLEAERLEAERLEAERLEAERLEAERLEAERLEAERLEAERLEAERLEAEWLEAERLEAERLEAEWLAAQRLEAERVEAEQLEAKRLEAERLEAERVEAEQHEAERIEAEQLEAERLEAERLEAERLEAERLEAERLEAERLEAERLEAERLEAERLEAERLEAERLEAERLEAERFEAERLEAERLEAERLEAERLEAERLEAERLEAERLEAERLEAERLEAERLEAERLEAERLEAERLEAERLEAERIEADRLEVERLAAERLEAERLEAERLEAERLEAERLEAERLEAERLEAERLEAERLEAERLEAERLEAERLEAERLEAERLEAERLEAERLEAERLEAERLEAERLEAERLEAERLEAERLEAERLEAERLEAERLEAERLEAERLEAERLEAERTAASAAESTDSDEVTVGDVTLSAVLLEIMLDEADQHLATLSHGLAVLQFDPQQLPSQEMVRASHTLCGIHRTGGFPLVASLAKTLEMCLIDLQFHESPLRPTVQPVLARAVLDLDALVARIKSRAGFETNDQTEVAEVVLELQGLHRMPTELAVDAEAHAAALADRDEPHAYVDADEAAAPEPAAASPERAEPADVAPEPMPAATEATAVPTPDRSTSGLPIDGGSQAVPAVAPANPLAGVSDDIDAQVLPIFLEEAGELFPRAGELLRAWRRDPEIAQHAAELRRTLHTFKGSARMAGAMRLGQLTHEMEARLLTGDALATGTTALFDTLESELDNVAFVLDALRAGRYDVELPVHAPTTIPAAAGEAAAVDAGTPAPAVPAEPEPVVSAAEEPAVALAAMPGTAAAPEVTPQETDASQRALLRVRADVIDRLVNEAGEVSIARARVEGELRSLKANLLELTNSVIRLRKEVRELEIQGESQIQSRMSQVGETAEGFDPLEFDRFTRFQELTRSLAEGINDVSTVQQSLLRNLDDADAALVAQSRLSRDLQQQLFAIRTVPFGSLSDRLYRILRQLAKELDKRANLEIRGGQVELDRAVLEKLVGPLEHLLRNALDHGIEPRERRQAAGKSETGEIALTVRQVGNEIAIELADDGGGLNLDEIRAKAIAQQRIPPDAELTSGQLIEYIFKAGFSTAAQVTQVSGRGIGMDVVRSEIATLGGRIEVSTRAGQGTVFQIYLPLTLAVAQAVLVRAGGRIWALPAPMVEQVQQLRADDLIARYRSGQVDWQGRSYPFHYLPRLLGDSQHRPESTRHNAVLLLRSGHSVAAVHVDEMVGNQEVVVKNIGPQLARVSGIAGATVLGNGEIVLIINPVQLAQRVGVVAVEAGADERLVPGITPPTLPEQRAPLIMVVDDSLTVRKITGRLLTREGFKVMQAKDGLDALEVLAGEIPDVMLLDIEMPRMDGFELTRNMKGDPRLAHIPIIMITSRTAEKHRDRARELGVDLYLGKPYQEDELLGHLRDMLSLAA